MSILLSLLSPLNIYTNVSETLAVCPTEGMERRVRMRKQLPVYLKESRRYWNLKGETLGNTFGEIASEETTNVSKDRLRKNVLIN
jgi:hypothetical protein